MFYLSPFLSVFEFWFFWFIILIWWFVRWSVSPIKSPYRGLTTALSAGGRNLVYSYCSIRTGPYVSQLLTALLFGTGCTERIRRIGPKKIWRGSLHPVEICRITYFNQKKAFSVWIPITNSTYESDVDVRQNPSRAYVIQGRPTTAAFVALQFLHKLTHSLFHFYSYCIQHESPSFPQKNKKWFHSINDPTFQNLMHLNL